MLSPDEAGKAYYREFLPVVRAGLVECVVRESNYRWTFSKSSVFYKDTADGRKWIGFNLDRNMLAKIPKDSILNREDPLFDYVVTWKTPPSDKGEGLPIKCNPSPRALLSGVYPRSCSVDFFAKKSDSKSANSYRYIYNPCDWDFRERKEDAGSVNGLYRLNEKKYSSRVYYEGGETYDLNRDPDSEAWARIMHCIDKGISVMDYKEAEQELTFLQPIPILLGRILFINQMFSDMSCPEIPWKIYKHVPKDLYDKLSHILSKSNKVKGERP